MNKRMLVLLGLVIVAVGVLVTSLKLAGGKPHQKKTAAAATEEAATSAPSEESGTDTDTGAGTENFWNETAGLLAQVNSAAAPVYYHTPRRDPTAPAFTAAESASLQGPFRLIIKNSAPSSLTGILLGNGKAAAIINEKIYRTGDIFNGKRIVAIERNRVILKKGSEEEVLRLENGS